MILTELNRLYINYHKNMVERNIELYIYSFSIIYKYIHIKNY